MSDENLFPADMEEMTMEEEEMEELEEQDDYIGAAAFDRDFVRDGQNSVRGASGIDSWKQWCINCLTTEREASPLYSSDFGIAITEILQATTREEAESLFKAEAKEALEADPYERTDYVSEISFDWGTDSVNVYIEVVGIDGATIDFEVNLEGR
ncbi:Protein of uncharacterised function (DUF2634) [uncultured Eubacterium sp.]|nr:Protein of uncharacterised function (DUF2634) [uncultured Eubacterium sp.]